MGRGIMLASVISLQMMMLSKCSRHIKNKTKNCTNVEEFCPSRKIDYTRSLMHYNRRIVNKTINPVMKVTNTLNITLYLFLILTNTL